MYVILLIFHLHKQEECKRNMNFQPKHPYHSLSRKTDKQNNQDSMLHLEHYFIIIPFNCR